jgi:hypothetical protein
MMKADGERRFYSALYAGEVAHVRFRPARHRLAYRVCYFLFDLDELPEIDSALRLFAYNRPGLFSLRDRDHGPLPRADRSGPPGLRSWVDETLRTAGLDIGRGRVLLLTLPRIFGHVFNPISVFYCYGEEGGLQALIYEVNNTFGHRHAYVLRPGPAVSGVYRHVADKKMHVSPFIDMTARYDFRLNAPGLAPGGDLTFAIRESDAAGRLLHAGFKGTRLELSDRRLAWQILRFPFMTFKIIAGIHWEALKLWLKGTPFYRTPAPPRHGVTLGGGSSQS